MTEVNLVKRFYVLALFAFIALSVAACTRDKPADTPVPTLVAVRTVVTPPPTIVNAADVTTTVTATLVLSPTTPIPPVVITPTLVVVSPTVTPAPAPAPGTSDTYTVQWGDWINKIAAQLGVTPQALIAANPGINPNLITPGQKLNVPGASPVVPGTPVPTAPSSNPSTYTVQRGEWIYAIARKYNVGVPALLAANPGINPNFLYPGQVLNIPGGSSGTTPPDPVIPPAGGGNTYTVQPGDTLYSIAVRFKTTLIALQIQNKLANPNFISPGMVLTIPQ